MATAAEKVPAAVAMGGERGSAQVSGPKGPCKQGWLTHESRACPEGVSRHTL